MQSRFRRLAEKKGFKIAPIGNFINGVFTRRPDIVSVQYHGVHIFTAPRRIYGFPIASYRDMIGNTHPDYFELEHKLLSWNQQIKSTGWLQKQNELYDKSR